VGRGDAQLAMQRLPEALAYYDEALRAEPQHLMDAALRCSRSGAPRRRSRHLSRSCASGPIIRMRLATFSTAACHAANGRITRGL
jgi:hypothetical protein